MYCFSTFYAGFVLKDNINYSQSKKSSKFRGLTYVTGKKHAFIFYFDKYYKIYK